LNALCLQAFNLAPQMGRPRSATRSSIAVASWELVVSFTTKYAVSRQIKPRILELALEEGKATLVLSLFFVSCKDS